MALPLSVLVLVLEPVVVPLLLFVSFVELWAVVDESVPCSLVV